MDARAVAVMCFHNKVPGDSSCNRDQDLDLFTDAWAQGVRDIELAGPSSSEFPNGSVSCAPLFLGAAPARFRSPGVSCVSFRGVSVRFGSRGFGSVVYHVSFRGVFCSFVWSGSRCLLPSA